MKLIENLKFMNIEGKSDNYEFVISGVELEEIYYKAKKVNCYLNQLVFEIQTMNDSSNCNYEYTFPMAKD